MFKGRAFLAPCWLIAIWVLARASTYQDLGHKALILKAATDGSMAESAALTDRPEHKLAAWANEKPSSARAVFNGSVFKNFAVRRQSGARRDQPQKTSLLAKGVHILAASRSTQNYHEAEIKSHVAEGFAYRPQPTEVAAESTPAANTPTSRISVYGYAFWRDNGNLGLAPFAQYGGSQLGFVASYRLGNATTAPALFARVSGALDTLQGAEAAAGMRWRPTPKIPISLAIERRIRRNSGDAVAVYLFGGWSPDRLPIGAELSVYGQAGVVRADHGAQKIDYFYDGQVRLERRVVTTGKVHLTVGGGAWAGGQSGVNRVDAGPTATVNFGLGQTNLRLSADYRVRMAGNAAPPSGPAITLSASY